MNISRNNLLVLVLLIVITAAFRMIPYDFRAGMLGAPQIAMALFAGSVVKQKKWAFALPMLSMFLGDLVIQIGHWMNPGQFAGFYEGQFINYLVVASLTVIGFFVNSKNVLQIGAGALAAPSVYFVLSNFAVWAGNGGYQRPKTFNGLMLCYQDALPFFKIDLVSCLVWSTVLFGSYFFITSGAKKTVTA
jgi:hypothetical protein